MAMRDGIYTDQMDQFNFHTELNSMADGRVRARTTLGGKTFEAFDADERWAQEKLTQKVTEAVQSGDVILNEI